MRTKFRMPFVVAGFCALLSPSPVMADAVIGQPAPAFVTPTLAGKNVDLAEMKGKVVIVHFWATWCAACRDEMPALEAVWRQNHGKGLDVIAVSADRPRAHADVEQVMQYFTFPASLLGAATKNDFGMPTGIPITYVIGKDGRLADIWTPDQKPLTQAALGDEVKSLLEVKTEAKPDETKTDAKP